MNKRKEKGFTLIELLVTLTILGLLSALGASLLHLGSRSWSTVNDIIDNQNGIDAVQSLLRQEFTKATPKLLNTDAGAQVDFDGKESTLLLNTALPQALGGASSEVTFRAETVENGLKNLVMAWRYDSSSTWKQSVILTNIQNVRFSFYGPMDDGSNPHWQPTWINKKTLPATIKVDISFPAGDARIWPELIVSPMITMDVACIYNPATRGCAGQ